MSLPLPLCLSLSLSPFFTICYIEFVSFSLKLFNYFDLITSLLQITQSNIFLAVSLSLSLALSLFARLYVRKVIAYFRALCAAKYIAHGMPCYRLSVIDCHTFTLCFTTCATLCSCSCFAALRSFWQRCRLFAWQRGILAHVTQHTHRHTQAHTHRHCQATACKITAIFYCGSAWLPDTESIPKSFQAVIRGKDSRGGGGGGTGGSRGGFSGTLPSLGMLVTLRFVGFCYH